jgi:phosphatidylinositol-3-phosphatase
VDRILASPAWQAGGVLFITWDEGNSVDNRVATLVIASGMTAAASAVAYNHYSLLATIEDHLGLPRLGRAAGARPMDDLLP